MKFISSALALALCANVFGMPLKNQKNDPCCCFNQGDLLPDNCYASSYNAPAKIDLCNRCDNWPYNVWADVSFIYWYAAQDGLTIAHSAGLTDVPTVTESLGSTTLAQSSDYKPGFKVGLGFGFDEWELHTEYTWIRQTHSMGTTTAPTNVVEGDVPVWALNSWFEQTLGGDGAPQTITASSISSKWRLNMDILDVTGGRPYYQGERVTINPYGGLRAAWIRQWFTVNATVPDEAVAGELVAQPIGSHNHSHSWAVGPTFGANGYCLLGEGFRFEGKGSVSLLYTRYTSIRHREEAAQAGAPVAIIQDSWNNYGTVRPMAEAGLGLGWGTYFSGAQYHIDFAASYDFNVFWNQNMMRTLVDGFARDVATSNDLFLHGLTLTGRFDF